MLEKGLQENQTRSASLKTAFSILTSEITLHADQKTSLEKNPHKQLTRANLLRFGKNHSTLNTSSDITVI